MCKIVEDESPPILKAMRKDPRSEAPLAIASKWLRSCLEKHGSCKLPIVYQKQPKRLINVGNEAQNPFLVDSPRLLVLVHPVALSQLLLGGEPLTELTKNTMDRLRQGFPLDEFDPTIRDAIIVTRALGILYIWIDALCIV
jgi:hypothetical protein